MIGNPSPEVVESVARALETLTAKVRTRRVADASFEQEVHSQLADAYVQRRPSRWTTYRISITVEDDDQPLSRWRIDRTRGALVGGPTGPLTGQQWREQIWPSCPVCGRAIKVERVDLSRYPGAVRQYVIGDWECPNECDPTEAGGSP